MIHKPVRLILHNLSSIQYVLRYSNVINVVNLDPTLVQSLQSEIMSEPLPSRLAHHTPMHPFQAISHSANQNHDRNALLEEQHRANGKSHR